MLLSSALLGVGIGTVLGLTGAGGGILAVPALVLGVGMGMVAAKPVALLAVVLSAVLGAVDGLRQGLLRYKAALYMVLLGALASPVGQWLAGQMPPQLLALSFSAIMLVVVMRTWRGTLARHTTPFAQHKLPCKLDPGTGKFNWTPACFATLGAIGTGAGLLTGMLGVGGGFLIVPMLQRFTNLDHRSVVLTSLGVIALVSGTTVAQSLWQGGVSIAGTSWLFIAAAAIGMLASRPLAKHLSPVVLQRGFALLVLLATVLLLLRTFAHSWLPSGL